MPSNKLFLTQTDAPVLYRRLIQPRRIEEKMLKLLRQNRISKWFSGIGQEAIAVGTALSLKPEDTIMTMHRNLGIFTTREVPLYPLFCQLLGKKDGFSKGRERSFHFGIPSYNIVGMISHLAAMLPVGAGFALASKLDKANKVALAFCGEGSTSEGDFHEALNLAAVWDLPIIFLIENNGYALSTPTSEQYRCNSIVDKASGYGIKGIQVDGNSLSDVMEAVSDAREFAVREQKPILIEAMTFRMRGHEEASGTAYVPQKLLDEWARKDPIIQFEEFLLRENMLDKHEMEIIRAEADDYFKDDLERALRADEPVFDEETESNAIFAPAPETLLMNKRNGNSNGLSSAETQTLRFVDAIQASLDYAMSENDKTLIMGQDIAEYGGVFKITEGFLDKFGRERVRNTPIIESGVVGAAIGLAMTGYRPVVEMQFADFITCAFNQIVNNVAKSHYRWSPPLNITIRAPHGAGVGAGPFHSQSPESWFMQHPGIKVVVPSSVEDAFNLLYSSIHDPNPVLFLEHKMLYRSLKGEVSQTPVYEKLGKARVVKEGKDLSIITYGMGVHWALEATEAFKLTHNVDIEVIDLRTLMPLDMETVEASIQKTNMAVLLEESSSVLGPMAEVSAQITERCFSALDAPLLRCSSLFTPVPVNKTLEKGYLAQNRLYETIEKLLSY